MSELATPGQLRMSYLRWALVTVPALLLLGSLAAMIAHNRYNRRWFGALDLPAIAPVDWVFTLVWPLTFICFGLALAMVLHARGSAGRGVALLLFAIQLTAIFIWSLLFFGQHQVSNALYLISFALILSAVTTWKFAAIRRAAAWLMLPGLVWIGFAAMLNFQIDTRNPDAETLVPHAASTQI